MTTTSPPTLAQQIAFMRKRCANQEAHVAAGFDGGDNIPELERRRAILASLERLATEQEFHNIDDVVKIRELESHIARLAVERDELMREEKKSHSQIDWLMKKLAAAEREIGANYLPASLSVRIMRALDAAGETNLLETYKLWRMDAVDALPASQGGGDG